VEGVNPVRIIWDVLYGMAGSITGLVGLTPLGLGLILAGLLGLFMLWNLVAALLGKQGWTLYDREGEPPRDLETRR
jgi:hypothetical protein